MSSKKKLEVVIACPGDVEKEKELVKNSIGNINILAQHLKLELVPKDWKFNTFPSVGEYPQDVINKQFGNEYEALVAIFWSKVGTPTPNFPSGTVEEVERAIERQKADNSVNLMLYLKTAEIPKKQFNPTQFDQLKELFEAWSDRGVYYSQFRKQAEFSVLITRHLMLLAQEKYFVPNQVSEEAVDYFVEETNKIYEETDMSKMLINSLEGYSKYSKELSQIISRITGLIVDHGKRINSDTEELNSLLKRPKSNKIAQKIAKNLKGGANYSRKYAEMLSQELVKFRETFIKEYDQYNNAVLIASRMGKVEKEMMRDMNKMFPEMISSYEHFEQVILDAISSTQRTIEALPDAYKNAEKEVEKAYQLLNECNQDYFRILRESYNSSKKLLRKKWFKF